MSNTKLEEATENIGLAKTFRIVWGILTLLAMSWLCYGLTTVSNVASNQLESATARSSDAYQAGTAIGASLGIGFFLCTGFPFLLLFGFLYWRNGVAIREAKRHAQTIEAMQRQ
jgi:hypothetical protein